MSVRGAACKIFGNVHGKALWKGALWLAALVCAASTATLAQAPFVTDDDEVATYHRWHLEANNEYDILARAAYPGLRQDTQTTKFSFGAFKNIELGMDFPLLVISNSHTSGLSTPIGFGDADFSVKWHIKSERAGWNHPAMAASLDVEAPTGEPSNGLGSGLADSFINAIFQKSATEKTTMRLNTGVYLAGNTLTGLNGVRERGTFFVPAGSIVHQFTPRLDLGLEVTGAVNTNVVLPRGQLQTMLGGNYQINKSLSFDFGVIGGHFSGSPRAGVIVGFSKDF